MKENVSGEKYELEKSTCNISTKTHPIDPKNISAYFHK